jgi:Secretory lipase
MLLGKVSRRISSQRVAPPPRIDLRTRRERVVARGMLRGLEVYERLMARVLVDVTHPAEDPFYTPPAGLDAFRPGEVLDARRVEVRALRHVLRADAWQVKFRSTDTRGAAASGVTTLIVPKRVTRSVRPLLSYQCAIDSLGAAADPSYTLRRGSQWELPFMSRALRRGWAVVATDYTGPRHAFAAGVVAGRFVLDGIRAAIGFAPAGFDAATPIGLWGYSGGAHATLCAAEQHPTYAPELNVVGAAVGGLTVDPTTATGTFEDVYDGSVLSGIPLGAVIGVSRECPEVDLLGALTAEGRALVASAADMTVEQLFMSFPFLHWGDYLTVPGVMEIPGLRAAFEANGFGLATPSTAVYMYHGVHEQNLAIAGADEFVEKYRREGVNVTYRRVRLGEHITVTVIGAPGALRFLDQRFGTTRLR